MALEAIYVGKRLNMIAEVSAFDPCSIGISTRAAKYLITPIGDDTYDTDWCSNWKDALEVANELAQANGVKVRGV